MNRLKMVTIGGGSSYTPELIEGLILRADTLPIKQLWLVDIEEGREKLEIVANLARRMVKKANIDLEIHHTLNRREALKDADFVTTQIRVGQLAAREKDEMIPLSHGMLGQETNSAGGMFKGFRTIPVILDIARDMLELCPNAWLINFSNPAGMVTEALIRYSGLTRTIGLCNVPIGMERMAAGYFDAEPEDISIRFAGINHLVYGLDVRLNGEIVTAALIDKMAASQAQTVANIDSTAYDGVFLKQLGVIPCAYHEYYYKSGTMLAKGLKEYEKGESRARVVMQVEKELFEEYKNEDLAEKPKHLEKRGGAYYSEAACRLIESIYTDRRDIQPVVTKNNGAIKGLPHDASVEVSAVITKDGPIPLNVGHLPTAINGLVVQMKAFESLAVEAAVEGSYEKAVFALGINPLTHSDIVARRVVDELMEAHKDYLGQFFK